MDPQSYHLLYIGLVIRRGSFLDAAVFTDLPSEATRAWSHASYLLEFLTSEMKLTMFEFVFVGKLRLFRRQCDMKKRFRSVCLEDSKATLADKFTHSSLCK